MGYKQLETKSGFITTSKKVNNLSSPQSYRRTISACTKNLKYFELQSDLSYGYHTLIKFYFNILKMWAVSSHNTMNEYYLNQRPVMYVSTFGRYLSGKYVRIDISRLFGLFSYFKYNVDVHERLKAVGCDLSGVDFIDNFLKLVDVPLINGEVFNKPFNEEDIVAKRYKKIHPQK